MARSTYIYIIVDPTKLGMESVIAAFTVKHEMQSYIKNTNIDTSKFDVFRISDRPRYGQINSGKTKIDAL